MKGDQYRRLDALLESVLPHSSLAVGLRHQRVLDRWEDIVGPQVAAHSRAVGLSHGVLLVQVENSVWAQELSMLTTEIRRTLDEKLGPGTVRDIRFHTGRPEGAPRKST